jgi:lincosamide nucleotidyltransferase A/C/D/E
VPLSQIVYRNPPIARERVLEVLRALDTAGVRTVLIGGWGIDALAGRQLRRHGDLDLLAERGELRPAIRALAELGFEPWHGDDSPLPIGKLSVSKTRSLRDPALRVVELHEADLCRLPTVTGSVAGHRVSCLPPEHQLEAQRSRREKLPQRRLRKRQNLAAVKSLQHPGSGA